MKKILATFILLSSSIASANVFAPLQQQINEDEKLIKFFDKLYACEQATVRDKFFQYDIEGVNNENLCVMTIQNKYSMRKCEFSVMQAREISDAEIEMRDSRIDRIIEYGNKLEQKLQNNNNEPLDDYSADNGYSNILNKALNNMNTCYYLN